MSPKRRACFIAGTDQSAEKTQARAVLYQKADLFYSQDATLSDQSIEAII
jgi:hypothetical protein